MRTVGRGLSVNRGAVFVLPGALRAARPSFWEKESAGFRELDARCVCLRLCE